MRITEVQDSIFWWGPGFHDSVVLIEGSFQRRRWWNCYACTETEKPSRDSPFSLPTELQGFGFLVLVHVLALSLGPFLSFLPLNSPSLQNSAPGSPDPGNSAEAPVSVLLAWVQFFSWVGVLVYTSNSQAGLHVRTTCVTQNKVQNKSPLPKIMMQYVQISFPHE